MVRNMKNPFQYGGVVGEDAFCNRKREMSDLLRAIQNAEKVFMYSERRLGKTSLIKLLLKKLPKKQYLPVYIDLWPTDNEQSFITTVAKAISKSTNGTAEGMLKTARSLFSRLTPTVSLDESGNPSLSFGINKSSNPDVELEEVLAAPQNIAITGKKTVVIIFDEFQRIMEYGNDLVERKLRSLVQTHSNVSYIFMGSKKNMIQKMFIDKSRPLYRSARHYPLQSIAEDEWLPFIRERFERYNKHITDTQIRIICAPSQGHPFYVQHLCFILWELCEQEKHVTSSMIDQAIATVIERESYAFTTLWESLTSNQRRFLKALAHEPSSVKPFSSDFLQRYNLGSSSSAQRIVKALLDKDIIDREDGTFIITDRFLRLWLRAIELSA